MICALTFWELLGGVLGFVLVGAGAAFFAMRLVLEMRPPKPPAPSRIPRPSPPRELRVLGIVPVKRDTDDEPRGAA